MQYTSTLYDVRCTPIPCGLYFEKPSPLPFWGTNPFTPKNLFPEKIIPKNTFPYTPFLFGILPYTPKRYYPEKILPREASPGRDSPSTRYPSGV